MDPRLLSAVCLVASLVGCHCLPVNQVSKITNPSPSPTPASGNLTSGAETSIKKATKLLESLNEEVKRALASSEGLDTTALVSDEESVGQYSAVVDPNEVPREQKFSEVLRDIEDLEEHVQDAIRNFTTNRRFAFSAMLRPMLTHIHQLRTNLTLLRNRMIGIVALNSISQQVNSLQDEVGDAITSLEPSQPQDTLLNSPQEEDELKAFQDSLGWVTE